MNSFWKLNLSLLHLSRLFDVKYLLSWNRSWFYLLLHDSLRFQRWVWNDQRGCVRSSKLTSQNREEPSDRLFSFFLFKYDDFLLLKRFSKYSRMRSLRRTRPRGTLKLTQIWLGEALWYLYLSSLTNCQVRPSSLQTLNCFIGLDNHQAWRT